MEIKIIVPSGITTSKTVAWGGKAKELFHSSQEAIRHAVQNCPNNNILREWLESRKKLDLTVNFCLSKKRVSHVDIDSMLSDLLNPLVEGACGPRPGGRPIPQTKDALFWRVLARKIKMEDERIEIFIKEYEIE